MQSTPSEKSWYAFQAHEETMKSSASHSISNERPSALAFEGLKSIFACALKDCQNVLRVLALQVGALSRQYSFLREPRAAHLSLTRKVPASVIRKPATCHQRSVAHCPVNHTSAM